MEFVVITIFCGENRADSINQAKKILGQDYEIIDAENLAIQDLPSIFLGTTIFADNRNILIKDLSVNKENYDELLKYLDTSHNIVIIEDKLNGTWGSVKSLKKDARVKIQENKNPETNKNKYITYDIFNAVFQDPEKAFRLLKTAEKIEDPYLMFGAWASIAVKNFKTSPTAKNRKILKELAKTDVLLKTSQYSSTPWLVLESLIRNLQITL